MSDTHLAVASLLMDIEAAMRNLNLWEGEPPTAEALASTQPFCVDTMDFSQWLQFVFLERMQILIDQALPLPNKCAIAPMAEEFFQASNLSGSALIELLRQLDNLLNEKDG